MGSNPKQYYYLSSSEFALLLASVGRMTWSGVFDEDMEIGYSEQDIKSTLVSLYQKEAIEWENGKATLQKDYRAIFECLKGVKRFVTAFRIDQPSKSYIFYPEGNKVVVVQKNAFDKKNFRIALMSIESLIEELCEEKFFIESKQKSEESDLVNDIAFGDDLNVLEEKGVYAILEEYEFSQTKQRSRILIREKGLAVMMHIQSEVQSKVFGVEKIDVRKNIYMWLKGEEK